jgi:hypothetical protein
MSKETDTERVSAAYRDLATETTPERLDRRILERAARESRSRYGAVRAWIRPLAWAATIFLSLAFLLELTWFADAPPVVAPVAPAAPVDERARRDADVMRAKEEDAVRLATPRQAEVSTLVEGAVPDAASAEQAPFCDDAARASGASWYACIEGLRETGFEDAAETELKALLETFPDFRVPPAE